MEILDAYDLTRSFRDAGEPVGCSRHTVEHSVEKRESAGRLDQPPARPMLIDPYLAKVEELYERDKGKIRADVVHDELTARLCRSERTTRRAVAGVKKAYRSGRTRVHRPWIAEPGMWLQYDFGDGPRIDGVETILFCAWLT